MRREAREIARQQQEIANQRAGIMVLQMRPHFIYNTLMSIYSLCNQDPQKARQVTMDFTNYLRKNFNAVASDSAIPFSTELEHTRAYLAVEQAQYEELLVVEYDTPFTRFRLNDPTLFTAATKAGLKSSEIQGMAGAKVIAEVYRENERARKLLDLDTQKKFSKGLSDQERTDCIKSRMRFDAVRQDIRGYIKQKETPEFNKMMEAENDKIAKLKLPQTGGPKMEGETGAHHHAPQGRHAGDQEREQVRYGGL